MQYVWDLFVRVFHWSLVVAFAVAFFTHNSEWQRVTHVYAGYAAGILIISRIAWGFMKSGYANFKSFPLHPIDSLFYIWQIMQGSAKRFIGHNPAGSLVIYAMLGIGIVTTLSGFLVYNDGWLIDAPDPELLQTVHSYAAWTWLVLIVLHVSGVIFESIVHHDNLIYAMITGFKRKSKKNE